MSISSSDAQLLPLPAKKPAREPPKKRKYPNVEYDRQQNRYRGWVSRYGKVIKFNWRAKESEAYRDRVEWLRDHPDDLKATSETVTIKDVVDGFMAEHKASVSSSTFDRSDESKVRLHILGGRLGEWKHGRYIEPKYGPKVLGDVKLKDFTVGQLLAALRNARSYRGSGKWSGEVIETDRPLSDRSREMVWGLWKLVHVAESCPLVAAISRDLEQPIPVWPDRS